MNKEIKDYLHLYLGCKVIPLNNATMTFRLCGIGYDGNPLFVDDYGFKCDLGRWKLSLRPLSDMSDENSEPILDEICEAIGVAPHLYYQAYSDILLVINGQMEESSLTIGANEMAEITRILCKHSIDVFRLIEAGLAIDKSKIKST